MSDIVQTLRDLYRSYPTVMEAADEIERLRKELSEKSPPAVLPQSVAREQYEAAWRVKESLRR